MRFGWLTPLLAIFVAIDIATFWAQAWVVFRGAPFNLSLLVLSLIIAATFYVAASITFPRLSSEGDERYDLDEHFWTHRRMIFACVMVANLIVAGLIALLGHVDEGFARVAASVPLWIGVAVFCAGTALAAFSPWRRVTIAALILLVLYHGWNLWKSASQLVASSGWTLPTA